MLVMLLSSSVSRCVRVQRGEQLSALLPHVDAAPYIAATEINLSELGLTGFSGIAIPLSIGPFSYFDARFAVNQSLFNWKSINATRAATQSLKAADYTYKDARDLVVLAIGYTYLQPIAAESRIAPAE